jgi:hypothetical protein
MLATYTIMSAWAQDRTAPGDTKDGFMLALTADQEAYQVGEPIMVAASFTNVGHISAAFQRESPAFFFFYRFIVVRTVGMNSDLVPLTTYGNNQIDVHNLSSVGGYKLKLSEQNRSVFKLNDFYQMTAPGVYKILAVAHMRTPHSGSNKTEFRSSLLTLTVGNSDSH